MGSCFQGLRAALYRIFGFRIGTLSIVPWTRSRRIRQLGEADPKAENAESSNSSSQRNEGDQAYQDQLNAALEAMNRELLAQPPPAETAAEKMNRLMTDYRDSLRRTEQEIQLRGLLSERLRQLEQERKQLLGAQDDEDEPENNLQDGMDEIADGNSTDEENEEFQRQLQAQKEAHAREFEQVRQRRHH